MRSLWRNKCSYLNLLYTITSPKVTNDVIKLEKSENKRLEAQLDIASRKSLDTIALADHEQIVSSIRIEFANRVKATETGQSELEQVIRQRDSEIDRLHQGMGSIWLDMTSYLSKLIT